MSTTTVTSKGQSTIPGELRLLLNILPGDKIFYGDPDMEKEEAKIKIIYTNNAVSQLYGSLHQPGMKYASMKVTRKKVGLYLTKELGLAK